MDVQGHHVKDFDNMKNPGDFIYSHRNGQICGMIEVCPCGCGEMGSINFDPNTPGPRWVWNGNQDSPTLTPSILRTVGCKWHGYLTDGVFKAC